MLKLMLRGTLAATMCLAGATVSADDTKTEKKKDSKVETRVLKMSKRVTVGPDGKIEIEEIGDSSKLPKKALEALKKAGINIKELSKPGAMSLRILADGEGNALDGIKLDGDMIKLTGDAIKLGGEMSGKIVIVGEDGKQNVHEFGSKLPMDADAIAKKVREAMKKQLKGNGEAQEAIESAMKQVESALSGIDGKIRVQVRSAFDDVEMDEDVIIINGSDEEAEEADEDEEEESEVESKVLSKLDLILKRIEKLEADVKSLQEKDLI
ncbi:MAG: hypothetical protein AAFX06_02060 [Planctomycetota bacterium]